MLYPENYALKEGETAPENTTVKECKYCHGKFAIPNGELDTYKSGACEGCRAEFDKDVATASAALMKAPTNADTAAQIQKALGK